MRSNLQYTDYTTFILVALAIFFSLQQMLIYGTAFSTFSLPFSQFVFFFKAHQFIILKDVQSDERERERERSELPTKQAYNKTVTSNEAACTNK